MKKLFCILLSLAMVMSLVACGGKNNEKETESIKYESNGANIQESIDANKTYKKHVNLSVWAAVPSLDPLVSSVTGAAVIHNLFSNQLVEEDVVNGGFLPELAEKWEIPDGKTYKFWLKKGILFHNGEELKAEDVKYSLYDRVLATGNATTIESVEIIDDYTLVIHLQKANSEYLYTLDGCSACILNKKACEADPEKGFWVGTGGWKVTDWLAADHADFEKFKDSYVWKEEGDIPTETLTIKCMTSGTTEACQAGDVANTLTSIEEIQNVLMADSNVEWKVFQSYGWWRIMVNHGGDSIFADDPNLLLAVMYALDRDAMYYNKYGEYATKAPDSYFPNYMFGYTNAVPLPEYNLEKSAEYLAKSKHPDGKFTIRLQTLNQSAGYANDAAMVQSLLEAAIPGCKVDITTYDSPTCKANAATQMGYEFYMSDNTGGGNGGKFSNCFGFKEEDGKKVATGVNYANYFNQEVVDLYDKYLATADEKEQLDCLAKIQAIINVDCPYVPFAAQQLGVAWHKGVSGLNWKVTTRFDFHRVMWAED